MVVLTFSIENWKLSLECFYIFLEALGYYFFIRYYTCLIKTKTNTSKNVHHTIVGNLCFFGMQMIHGSILAGLFFIALYVFSLYNYFNLFNIERQFEEK